MPSTGLAGKVVSCRTVSVSVHHSSTKKATDDVVVSWCLDPLPWHVRRRVNVVHALGGKYFSACLRVESNFKSGRLRPLVDEPVVGDSMLPGRGTSAPTWHKDDKNSTDPNKGIKEATTKNVITTNGKAIPSQAPRERPQTCDRSQKRDKILEGPRRFRPQSAPHGTMGHQQRWPVGNALATFARWGLRQENPPDLSSCLGKSGGNEVYRKLAVIGQNNPQSGANASCDRAECHKVAQQISKQESHVDDKTRNSHDHRTPASSHRRPQEQEDLLLPNVEEKGALDDLGIPTRGDFRKPSMDCFSTPRQMVYDSPSSERDGRALESEGIRRGDSIQERFYKSIDGTPADGGTKVEETHAQIHGELTEDIPRKGSTATAVCLPAKGARYGSLNKETPCATQTLRSNLVKSNEIFEGTLHQTLYAKLAGNNPSDVSPATKSPTESARFNEARQLRVRDHYFRL